MFTRVDIHVTLDDGISIQFTRPLSIIGVTVVCSATEEIEWELINDAFKPVDGDVSMSQSWLIDEAPEWALQALESMENEQARRLEAEGPCFPTRQTLKYGEVPPGYREDLPAKTLVSGSHAITVFAEQGSGFTVFDVP